MNKKSFYILSALLLCTSISSFARPKRKAKKEPSTKTLIIPQEKEPDYNIKVGETFTISFRANPSTGSSWAWLVSESAEERPLELIKTEYKPDHENNSSDPAHIVVGGGGTITFTFKAQKAIDYTRIEAFVYGQLFGDPKHWIKNEFSVKITE